MSSKRDDKAQKVEEYAKNVQQIWNESDIQPGLDLQVLTKDYVMELVENLDKKYTKGQSIDLKENLDKTCQKVQSKLIIFIQ